MYRIPDWVPWVVPAAYAAGMLGVVAAGRARWPLVGASTRIALGVAILASGVAPAGLPGARAAHLVAVLVAFLGWIIGDYASRYLRGEPGQHRFAIAFLGTLAGVSTVIVSGHFAVLVAAWSASSVALHHLLTYYRERTAALLVAHKKFLASRLAELLLLAAALLLHGQWGTLDLGAIATHVRSAPTLPPMADAAAVLVALAVLLKCAQLPLHGWLIQVMEAPTPVSALLHAGVVNLGGFVLIRLAPLIGASAPAEGLLVVVGSLTAALAGLVMLTRITIKVRLAWSTCSQMGLMVVECGLGLYDLALLHLLAHALYKAHAFLVAGEAVRDGLERRDLALGRCGEAGTTLVWVVLSLPLAWLVVAGSALLWQELAGLPPLPWIALALFGYGMATLLWAPRPGRGPDLRALLALMVGTQVYLGWHWLLAGPPEPAGARPSPLLGAWTFMVFGLLYAAQATVAMWPRGDRTSRLYDWVYAGLYLDERFTRLTFRIWPARLRSPA